MARKKKEDAVPSTDGGYLDDIIDVAYAAVQDAEMRDGTVYTGGDEIAELILLPTPALSLRYLTHTDGWPLSRFTLGTGKHESCKSAFGAEFIRWHRDSKGFGVVIETEVKDASTLRQSILDYDRNAIKSSKAHTQAEWFQLLMQWWSALELRMDGRLSKFAESIRSPGDAPKKSMSKEAKAVGKATGRIAPVAFVIDSLSAGATEKLYQQVFDDSVPTQDHPRHAKELSDFLKVAPKRLHRMPLSVYFVSHLKEGTNVMSHQPSRETYGGRAPKHQITLELEFIRTKKHDVHRVSPSFGELHYIPLDIQVYKNSLGAHSRISVDFCWYFDTNDRDPLTDRARQKSFWDWHSSSIELLLQWSRSGDHATKCTVDGIQDLVGLSQHGDGRFVTSDQLGIPDSNPISFYEAGVLLEDRIQNDPTFQRDLYDLMGIHTYPKFAQGVCMLTQIEQNLVAMRDAYAKAPKPLPIHLTAGQIRERLGGLAEGEIVDGE